MKICPKCSYARQPTDTNPEWQCPSCSVAYNKAADAGRGTAMPSAQPQTDTGGGMPWGKLVLVIAIAWGGWTGIKFTMHKHGDAPSLGASISNEVSAADLSALAKTVATGDVTIYTTTECPYCAQAKSWMSQYGFSYIECDTQARSECAREMQALGAVGVPFLVVRGKKMNDGFDSDQFLALLKT